MGRGKPAVLTALRLTEDPAELLRQHTDELDARYREVADRCADNTAVSVDEQDPRACAGIGSDPRPAQSGGPGDSEFAALDARATIPVVYVTGEFTWARTSW